MRPPKAVILSERSESKNPPKLRATTRKAALVRPGGDPSTRSSDSLAQDDRRGAGSDSFTEADVGKAGWKPAPAIGGSAGVFMAGGFRPAGAPAPQWRPFLSRAGCPSGDRNERPGVRRAGSFQQFVRRMDEVPNQSDLEANRRFRFSQLARAKREPPQVVRRIAASRRPRRP